MSGAAAARGLVGGAGRLIAPLCFTCMAAIRLPADRTRRSAPMAAHWIYINSPRYRAFVEASKQNKLLLYGATAALCAAGGAAAYVASALTNPGYVEEGAKDKSAEVARMPLQDQVRSGAGGAAEGSSSVCVGGGRGGGFPARARQRLAARGHGMARGLSGCVGAGAAAAPRGCAPTNNLAARRPSAGRRRSFW
jgi:hypothetical protein